MSRQISLKSALDGMKNGSKSGFHRFFSGTIQYIYQSSRFLFSDEDSAHRFILDFYEYLYLHISEYHEDLSMDKWISKLLLARYHEIFGNRPIDQSSMVQRSRSYELSEKEKKQLWIQLQSRIHFPADSTLIQRFLIICVFLILGILLFRQIFKGSGKSDSSILENTTTQTSVSDTATSTSNFVMDEISQLGNSSSEDSKTSTDYSITDKMDTSVDTDTSKSSSSSSSSSGSSSSTQKSSSESTPSVQSPSVETPSVETPSVETPTVETPQVTPPTITTPSSGGSSSSSSGSSDSSDSTSLSDLKLHLRGDTNLED